MRRIVRDEANGNIPLSVLGLKEARTHIKNKKEELKKKLYFNGFLTLISPPLGIVSSLFTLGKYYKDFYDMFLSNSALRAEYEKIFAPVVSSKVYTVFGYRIYQEDLNKHFPLVLQNEKLPELIKKGLSAKKKPFLQVGFDIGTLTTHLAFIGTTGAGKTETILSFVQDILKSGGGFMMIDGKADQTIEQKLYALCLEYGYETQFLINNYLEPEKRPPTNSFSPVLSLKTAQLKEFLNDLLPSSGGDTDYFATRGKVAISYPITYMKLRQIYYQEAFTFSDITNYIEDIEFTFVYIMSFSTASELNEFIKEKAKENPDLRKYLQKAKKEKIAKLKDIEEVDVLVEFMTRNPEKRKEIENILGIDIDFMAQIADLVTGMDNYIAGVHSTWKKYAYELAKVTKAYIQQKYGKKFLYINPNTATIKDVREAYNTFKNNAGELDNIVAVIGKENVDSTAVAEAIGLAQGGETLEKLNQDSMRQHQYAQQQWDRVFQLFNMYKHVFNDLYPDVDLADVIRNNKILYVMLPILNMANDQIIMIAKMYVILIKLATSLGLGGENQEAMPLQLKIYQTKLKPLPLYMIILEEWGSYATTGMATQNAQARSLKISMVYSTQDKESFHAENDDREMKRILGNMKKLILKVEDDEMLDYVEKYVGEIEVIKEQNLIKDIGDSKKIKADTTSYKIEKEPAFPVKKLSKFAKGLTLFINGDEPAVVQSYYVGGNDAPLNITRYKGFEEEWENVY